MRLNNFCFLVLMSLVFVSSFAQETPPPKDPTGAVRQKGSAEWLMNQGHEQLNFKKYNEAIESFTQALVLNPKLIMAYHGLTMTYLRLSNFSKAQETADKALATDPNDFNAHLAQAQVYSAQNQPGNAIKSYEKVTQLAPNLSTGFYDLGTAYTRTGKFPEAVVALQESIRLNPNWVGAHMNLALTYFQLKKDDEGMAELKMALKVEPNAFFAAEKLGREGIRLGRYNDALQGYDVLSHAPMDPQFCQNVAFAMLYSGKGEFAARSAEECLQLKGRQDRSAPYLALFQHLGWRVAKNEKMASLALANSEIFNLSASNISGQWPLPVVKYLRREISAEDLMKVAGNNDEQTEAHAYLGYDLSISGKTTEAIPHLQWVKDNGNRNFVEYPLSVLELHRIAELKAKTAK